MPQDFVATVERVVDDLLDSDPTTALWAGDHRADHRLPDYSDDAVRGRVARLKEDSHALSEIDADGLGPQDAVDLEQLQSTVDRQLFALTELREHEWNPLVHIPGFLLNSLLLRPSAPADQRLAAVISRLEDLPDALATADRTLADCPRIHVTTALAQWNGMAGLVQDEVPRLAAQAGLPNKADVPIADALQAIERHRETLQRLADRPGRSPRLGDRLWEAKLWHTLDSPLTAAEVLAAARDRLDLISAEIAEVAGQLTGRPDPKAALDELANDRPDDRTIVPEFERVMVETTRFVRDNDLVTVYDDPYQILVMPEFARGVAGAYCDAPGPLEEAAVPTFLAVSPTPAGWSAELVESYYRELNNHMVRNLAVHEAMPGHYLQLAHANRFRSATRARALCGSGTFVEGWAVYAEQLMTEAGYGGPRVRMQQLKMQLRMIINAIIDNEVHCGDMAEAAALDLMRRRGFQEESEAVKKWDRTLLTSTQLSTYFVGYTEVAAIAAARPAGASPREWHDAMLAHGSPSPRHLRTLLGL
ncbi:DUF885 domain-containing protein [Fodinicola acaciae]|uniref:DUF885 domain-containing protein n=1 Tax=Fodinicola acaciae TaxID=2681555 RepID=UPI0013CF7EFF|nr:DUF885 domain-containing protein [Fodinicola acaciae]